MTLQLPRRSFTTGFAVTTILGCLGCAGKKDKPKTEMPSAELGGLFKKFDKRINKAVPDKARRKAAKAEMAAIEEKILELDNHYRDMRSRFAQMPEEDRDTLEEARPITQAATQNMVDSLLEACKHAMNLRQHITESEWPKVFTTEAV
jgi:ribosomal protein L16 Arg81 hydroxylase